MKYDFGEDVAPRIWCRLTDNVRMVTYAYMSLDDVSWITMAVNIRRSVVSTLYTP